MSSATRVVVCFRYRMAAARAQADAGLRAGVDELVGRAAALGGRVVGWHPGGVIFDFSADALEDAVDLVVDADAEVLEQLGAGVTAGEIDTILDAGATVALGRGEALSRATALAQIAHGGEVLLDPALEQLHGGRLLSNGSRIGAIGRERVRGSRLDLSHPWRRDTAVELARVSRPARVGTPLPIQLAVDAGKVSVVRADRGSGGTRFLDDLADEHSASRVLAVLPHPLGEPLGALRVAMARASASGGNASRLAPDHAASLESLLAGEGLDVETSCALVAAWIPGGVVLVDDAPDVDADTLEAVAAACAEHGLGAVARIHPGATLPPALRDLPRAGELVLEPLGGVQASELVRASLGGDIDERDAARWARRGGGMPLAIREALLESIESAELVRDDGRFTPRVRLAGRGRAHAALHWAARRLRFVAVEDQPVLAAVAVLGGEAEPGQIAAMLDRAAPHVGSSLERLQMTRWLVRTSATTVALATATEREAIVAALASGERARLHHAAAAIYGASAVPLAAASACVHALLAGDHDAARALARRASAAARAAGLGRTADAFERFSAGGPAHLLVDRGLAGGFAASVSPESGHTVTERAPTSTPASVDSRRLDIVAGMVEGAVHGAADAVAKALREGDFDAVDRVVEELRGSDEHAHIADRLAAMACLARGETSEALRLLRSARDLSRRLGPAERGRAALAHGVGLAAAGRTTDALLEALAALARSREAGDDKGERACARFIARLSLGAGENDVATAWEAIAAR